MKTKSLLSISFIALFAAACSYKFKEVPKPSAGNQVSFAKYVAIGNSLTAGYMDGALYNRGQANNYAAILAKQFRIVGGGEFNQPDINSENGFFGLVDGVPVGRLILRNPANPAPVNTRPGNLPTPYTGDKSKLNNFAVPGLTLAGALSPQTALQNPFYGRFASNPGVSTPLSDFTRALRNGGTFFSVWLGSNDVLGYAMSGGTNTAALTSQADFSTRFNQIIDSVLAASPSAKGFVMNVPNVLFTPFFQAIAWNNAELKPADSAALTAGWAMFNAGVNLYNSTPNLPENLKRPNIIWRVGRNGFVIEDPTLPTVPGLPKYRQLRSGEFVLFTAFPRITGPERLGTASAIPDNLSITSAEAQQIGTSVAQFNAIIKAKLEAHSDRILAIDADMINLNVLANNPSIRGVTLTGSILPPSGGYSLDAIHPNARYHAYFANEILKAINKKWGSSIPELNPNDYVGNDLPN